MHAAVMKIANVTSARTRVIRRIVAETSLSLA
jgi:hypothetical protein